MMRALVLAFALACATACGASAHRVAVVSVVAVGAATAQLHEAHLAAYTRSTDALMQRLRASGGTMADYDREAQPLNETFQRRGRAIQALDVAVYGAAGLIDAAKTGGAAAYATAARRLLEAVRAGLAALREGGPLAPVAIPAELTRVVDQLAVIAGGA